MDFGSSLNTGDAEATWLALPKLLHPLRGNRLFERLVGLLCVNQNVRVNENGASRVMVMFFIPGPSKHRPKIKYTNFV